LTNNLIHVIIIGSAYNLKFFPGIENIAFGVVLGRREGMLMAKRNPNTYMKRQKEIKRQQKAQEKMARRQSHKTGETDDLLQPETAIEPETAPEPEKSEE